MDYYKSQDGLKYELQQRFNKNEEGEFPPRGDYLSIFHAIEEKMNKEWHPVVTLGAAVTGNGLLTDHGVDHVQEVIRHAGQILSNAQKLTGYELFILLLAIHFHDVGNIYGRKEHEQRIADIINNLGDSLPLSSLEKQLVSNIATAHGGYCNGDKDTISYIGPDTKYSNVSIRPKVLAAILRFADEISDDMGRSPFPPETIPEENRAYHEYSRALASVSISGDTIILQYQIPYELTQKKIGKGKGSVFLYDEILDRIGKLMRELEYCKKYAAELIKVSSVSVTIQVLEASHFRPIMDVGDSFRLTLQGYPDIGSHPLDLYMEKRTAATDGIKELKYKNGPHLKKCLARRA